MRYLYMGFSFTKHALGICYVVVIYLSHRVIKMSET
jgi:hypothetical protein